MCVFLLPQPAAKVVQTSEVNIWKNKYLVFFSPERARHFCTPSHVLMCKRSKVDGYFFKLARYCLCAMQMEWLHCVGERSSNLARTMSSKPFGLISGSRLVKSPESVFGKRSTTWKVTRQTFSFSYLSWPITCFYLFIFHCPLFAHGQLLVQNV